MGGCPRTLVLLAVAFLLAVPVAKADTYRDDDGGPCVDGDSGPSQSTGVSAGTGGGASVEVAGGGHAVRFTVYGVDCLSGDPLGEKSAEEIYQTIVVVLGKVTDPLP